MESPQSPHSSSLWVFALSAVESYRPLHPVPISHLGTKLLLYGSFVGWPKGHLVRTRIYFSAACTLNLASTCGP